LYRVQVSKMLDSSIRTGHKILRGVLSVTQCVAAIGCGRTLLGKNPIGHESPASAISWALERLKLRSRPLAK